MVDTTDEVTVIRTADPLTVVVVTWVVGYVDTIVVVFCTAVRVALVSVSKLKIVVGTTVVLVTPIVVVPMIVT